MNAVKRTSESPPESLTYLNYTLLIKKDLRKISQIKKVRRKTNLYSLLVLIILLFSAQLLVFLVLIPFMSQEEDENQKQDK